MIELTYVQAVLAALSSIAIGGFLAVCFYTIWAIKQLDRYESP